MFRKGSTGSVSSSQKNTLVVSWTRVNIILELTQYWLDKNTEKRWFNPRPGYYRIRRNIKDTEHIKNRVSFKSFHKRPIFLFPKKGGGNHPFICLTVRFYYRVSILCLCHQGSVIEHEDYWLVSVLKVTLFRPPRGRAKTLFMNPFVRTIKPVGQ